MKKNKKARVDDLFLEVVEFAFIEWLVRRNLFTAFQPNFLRTRTPETPFRDHLRNHIRLVYRSPYFGLDSLVFTAFLFFSTPEGPEFWLKQAKAWKRFFSKFEKHL